MVWEPKTAQFPAKFARPSIPSTTSIVNLATKNWPVGHAELAEPACCELVELSNAPKHTPPPEPKVIHRSHGFRPTTSGFLQHDQHDP